jgi:hypothetical protein
VSPFEQSEFPVIYQNTGGNIVEEDRQSKRSSGLKLRKIKGLAVSNT